MDNIQKILVGTLFTLSLGTQLQLYNIHIKEAKYNKQMNTIALDTFKQMAIIEDGTLTMVYELQSALENSPYEPAGGFMNKEHAKDMR